MRIRITTNRVPLIVVTDFMVLTRILSVIRTNFYHIFYAVGFLIEN